MNSSVTRSFREEFARLPPRVQEQAKRNYALWQENPNHPSLHFKKVGDYWSARVDLNHRVVGRLQGNRMIWFAIRAHAGYERLLPG